MSTAAQRTTGSSAAVFWQYWTGSTISGLGTAVTTVALPLTAVTVVRASALSVGLIAAAGNLPWVVLGLPAGVLVARLPPRGTQVAMDLIRALAIGSIPVLAWAGALSSAQLVAVALVVGSATVLFKVGNATMIPSIVAAEQLRDRNTLISASGGVTQLVGPGLGGVLVEALGAATCMLTDAISYLISAVLMQSLPRPPRHIHAAGATPAIHTEIGAGFRFIAHRPVLRATVVLGAVVSATSGAILALAPLYLVRELREPAYVVGLVYATEGAGGLVGAALTKRIGAALGAARATLWLTIPAAVGLILLPLSSSGWGATLFGLAIALYAGCLTVISILITTYRHRTIPHDLLPRVLATVRFSSGALAPIGAVLAGALADRIGTRAALFVLAAASLAIPASAWSSRALRTRREFEDV